MRGSEHPVLRFAVAFVCAFALLAGSAQAATVTQRDAAEPPLVARINDVRASHGLPALKVSSLLTSAASRHATNMAWKGYFRHEFRKDGNWISFGSWIRWYWPSSGYRVWTAGENLAWAAPGATAGQIVNWWMNSPGHRANLLGAWTNVGVGVVQVKAPGGFYKSYSEVTIFVAEFGKRA